MITSSKNKKQILVLVLKATSQIDKQGEYDYLLTDLNGTGLTKETMICCDKGYYLDSSEDYTYKGVISNTDLLEIMKKVSNVILDKKLKTINKN